MVINDKSQGSGAPYLRRGGSFDEYVISNLLLSFLSKNVKNWSTFDKVMDKKLDCIKRSVRCSTVLLKDKLDRDPTCGEQELL